MAYRWAPYKIKCWLIHRRAKMRAREDLARMPLLQAHFVDIRVRINGEYKWFQGDFLKWLR